MASMQSAPAARIWTRYFWITRLARDMGVSASSTSVPCSRSVCTLSAAIAGTITLTAMDMSTVRVVTRADP